MVKEFRYYTAWTDSMKYEQGFAGIIGYQRKSPNGVARLLWVIAPGLSSESDAAASADNMLDHIKDINCFGQVIFTDGVIL